MRSIEEVHRVQALLKQGLNDCEISRRTGIPRGTIRGWRHGKIPRAIEAAVAGLTCTECGHPAHEFASLPHPAYTYLLGLYLGDGCIVRVGRVYRLCIVLDRRYSGIVNECRWAMKQVMPSSKVNTHRKGDDRADYVVSYSKAWPCLFPQHGPGRKHRRLIELTTWQWKLVEADPKPLLRGLIHSDGCRHLNTIRHPNKTYRYPRYEFTNRSEDIKRIFCAACELLAIDWRVMNAKTISIARHSSVAKMDQFVGPKG